MAKRKMANKGCPHLPRVMVYGEIQGGGREASKVALCIKDGEKTYGFKLSDFRIRKNENDTVSFMADILSTKQFRARTNASQRVKTWRPR